MTTEKFEETKERFKELRKQNMYIRLGHVWGFISVNRDCNREEILELMDILFD